MFPRFSVYNSGYLAFTDKELSCQSGNGIGAVIKQATNCANSCFRYLRLPVCFTPCVITVFARQWRYSFSFLSDHVLNVIVLGAKEEMRWIYTESYVTTMTYFQSIRNWAKGKFIRYPMRQESFTIGSWALDNSVSSCVGPSPNPTSAFCHAFVF